MLLQLAIGAGIILGAIFFFLVLPVILAPGIDRLTLAYIRWRISRGGMLRAHVADAIHRDVEREMRTKKEKTPKVSESFNLGPIEDEMDKTDTDEMPVVKDRRQATTVRLKR